MSGSTAAPDQLDERLVRTSPLRKLLGRPELGSVVGAAVGAVIFGMVLIGLTYTNIDQDWYLVFLGGMLLMAVFFNNIIRRRVTGER